MTELIEIFKNIKKEFCFLWNFKERGSTLEIITPYTTADKFVSVFLTTKNKEFIVSDGGWLNDATYDTELDFKDDAFKRLFSHYKNFFDIEETHANQLVYYFKKTAKKEMIPSLVFDLTNFISAIASSTRIQFIDAKERLETDMFNKQANNFLSSIVTKTDMQKIHFRKHVDEKLKGVKFSAVVATGSDKLTLFSYVTGSTPEYFIGSIGKANLNFEVVANAAVSSHIKNKVAIIDNTATGFNQDKLEPLLWQLKSTTKDHNYFWNERNNLKRII